MAGRDNWLGRHRETRPYAYDDVWNMAPADLVSDPPKLLADSGFNNHATNDGSHVSPYDNGRIYWGTEGIRVNLLQGVNEEHLKKVLSRTLRATTGISPDETTDVDADAVEMFSGGLQSALESQVVIFEVIGPSRALTHQLVRTRKAAFHQQSQRATWYGDRPDTTFPLSIARAEKGPREHASHVELAWRQALLACWYAYKTACDAGVSYQDARYILPEGTTNYIICEYPLREFLNVYAYRACSGFLWEMVHTMREMGRVLTEAHPFLGDYVKISCEKPVGDCPTCQGTGQIYGRSTYQDLAEQTDGMTLEDLSEIPGVKTLEDLSNHAIPSKQIKCPACGGDGKARRCTFQGWENVEKFCDFPQARQSNRTFLPNPKYRIGG
jgi:thymidylate synthase (FAD)